MMVFVVLLAVATLQTRVAGLGKLSSVLPRPGPLQHRMQHGGSIASPTATAGTPPHNSNFSFIDTASWVGTEYTPARAANSLWWARYPDYEEDVKRELAAAAAAYKIKMLRVFLHTLAFNALGAATHAEYLNRFLRIATANEMKVGFVLFGDGWNHGADLPHSGNIGANSSCAADGSECCPQAADGFVGVKGCSNGCWFANPQDHQRGDVPAAFAGEGGSNASYITAQFKPFVEAVVQPLSASPAVLFWEAYNEPCAWRHFEANICTYFQVMTSTLIKELAYGWVRALKPAAPVISCWAEENNTFSEILDVHMYSSDFPAWSKQIYSECPEGALNAEQCSRGAVVTEAGARWFVGTESDSGSPLTVLNYLSNLQQQRQPQQHRPVAVAAAMVASAPPAPPALPAALECAECTFPPGGSYMRIANSTLREATAWCIGNSSCGSFSAETVTWGNNGTDACNSGQLDSGVHEFYFKVDRYFGNRDTTHHMWMKPSSYANPLFYCSSDGKCMECPAGSGECRRETYADQGCFGFCNNASAAPAATALPPPHPPPPTPSALFVPGVMLAWELMVGNSNTRWISGPPCYTPTAATLEPPIPWCGLLWPDGTPVSYTEAAATRKYLGHGDDFIVFDDFLEASAALTGDTFLNLSAGMPPYASAPFAAADGVMVEASLWFGPAAATAGGGAVLQLVDGADAGMWRISINTTMLLVQRLFAVARGGVMRVAAEAALPATSIPSGIPAGAWNILRIVLLSGSSAHTSTSTSRTGSETVQVWLNPTAHPTDPRLGKNTPRLNLTAPPLSWVRTEGNGGEEDEENARRGASGDTGTTASGTARSSSKITSLCTLQVPAPAADQGSFVMVDYVSVLPKDGGVRL